MRFLRMKPGHGEVLLTEGDPDVREDEEMLVEEFRRQLDEGMWAAVPTAAPARPARGRDGARVLGDPARGGAGDLLPARLRAAEPPMLLALLALSLVTAVLGAEAARARRPGACAGGGRARRRGTRPPGRVRPGPRAAGRAARARASAQSCVNDEEWAMYRDLGFIRVAGPQAPGRPRSSPPSRPTPTWSTRTSRSWPTCRSRAGC